jgi:hypothetical protein
LGQVSARVGRSATGCWAEARRARAEGIGWLEWDWVFVRRRLKLGMW